MLEGGGSTVSLLAALLNKFGPCPCLLCIYVKFPKCSALWEEGQISQGMCGHAFSKGRNRDLQEVGRRRGGENACGHLEAFLPQCSHHCNHQRSFSSFGSDGNFFGRQKLRSLVIFLYLDLNIFKSIFHHMARSQRRGQMSFNTVMCTFLSERI